jgi:hypothetical protein
MLVPPDLICDAVAETQRALWPAVDEDWSVLATDLEWSCWKTAFHIADDLVFYASQIIDQPEEGYVPFEITMTDGAKPEGLLRTIAVCGTILQRTAAAAQPGDRGYHVYGVSDAEGFTAMGVVETLVHTYDIATAQGLDWRPPAEMCAPVLARLFPDAPPGDPSAVLLWCTGRTVLAGRPRQAQWRWDGTVRT